MYFYFTYLPFLINIILLFVNKSIAVIPVILISTILGSLSRVSDFCSHSAEKESVLAIRISELTGDLYSSFLLNCYFFGKR